MIYQFFNELNNSSIRYFHFKSNLNLTKSFKGETDFDLLVHKDDYYLLRQFLSKYNAKYRHGTFNTVYCGVENYLLYDADEEKLFHFHIHYELMFGSSFRKNHFLPVNDGLFDQFQIHTALPIRVCPTNLELLLLIYRVILKHKGVKAYLRSFYRQNAVLKSMAYELDDLFEKVKLDEFLDWIADRYPNSLKLVIFFIKNYSRNHRLLLSSMMKIKVLFAHTFDDLIRIPPTSSRLQYEIRHLSAKESIRWVGSGGKLISFIGSDGSGKSTLSKDIQDWINYKLTSEIVYLGQQKSSFILSFYKLIGGITKRIKMDNVSSYIANRRTLIYARFRLNNLRHAKKKVRNGVIVLADRYPLREFRKMKVPMDGPRISSHLRVSKKEIDIYERMDEYPDIMIILNVDLYTSLKRTNDLDSANEVESRAHKIDAIQNLISKGFSDKTKFKVVDATQSYELVLKEIKRYIWRNI